jgi:hypothetical protein
LPTERKLDIFKLLNAVDTRNGDWLSEQSEDVRKEFAPPVIMRWVATVTDSRAAIYMLWMVNEQVNVHLFALHQHPDLVYRLLASCGMGRKLSHQWLAGNKRKVNNKAFALLAQHHPEANERELELLMGLHTAETFRQFVDDCGVQANEAKEMLKAYNSQ